MEISGLHAIILTSGKISLEKICGQEAILYLTKVNQLLGIKMTLIVNSESEKMKHLMQRYHAGTAYCIESHAHTSLYNALKAALLSDVETLLIFNGNRCCITAPLITELYTKHIQEKAVVSVVVPLANERGAYFGDSIPVLIVQRSFLQKWLSDMQQNSMQSALNVNDLVYSALDAQQRVIYMNESADSLRALATMHDLYAVERMKRRELITYWMNNGVRFACIETVHIDLSVTIGAESFIGAGVHLLGNTSIGKACHIQAYSMLEDVTVGDNTHIYSHSVIKRSTIGTSVHIGPFAHMQADNTVEDHAIIGNFVEMKRTYVGEKTKIKHVSYLGDARIGNGVNIGAGSITCNHDGFSKHVTTIEDNAYIGTNTILMAPVTIGHDAFTAAGSPITQDVPSYALAIARMRQINKEGYVHVLREKKEKEADVMTTSSESFMGAMKTEPKITSTDCL